MTEPKDLDADMEDDYDEEEDSDFDAGHSNDDILSSSSDNEDNKNALKRKRASKRNKIVQEKEPATEPIELDSGDEAALAEVRKTQRKLKRKGEYAGEASDGSDGGWRARTRGMREREKLEERSRRRSIDTRGLTINIEKLWEEMNRPGGMSEPFNALVLDKGQPGSTEPSRVGDRTLSALVPQDQENQPPDEDNEMITIKRKYKFAGQVTTEEKTVSKSSAEARLWLAEQAAEPQSISSPASNVRRPLRKISRFDPNQGDLGAFKGAWVGSAKGAEQIKARKLNVVDKSRQDWAADVDEKGDREELEKHAKSKQGYLGQQDSLNRLAQAREDNRLGRPKD